MGACAALADIVSYVGRKINPDRKEKRETQLKTD